MDQMRHIDKTSCATSHLSFVITPAGKSCFSAENSDTYLNQVIVLKTRQAELTILDAFILLCKYHRLVLGNESFPV